MSALFVTLCLIHPQGRDSKYGDVMAIRTRIQGFLAERQGQYRSRMIPQRKLLQAGLAGCSKLRPLAFAV